MTTQTDETLPSLNGTGEELPSVLASSQAFEHVQRVAKVYASSGMVPKNYQGNIADCIVALQMAKRMNVDPFEFMQNTYIVHGKPAIEGKFAVQLTNTRGPYPDGVRFKMEGEGDSLKVTAFGVRASGEVDSCTVSYQQAKDMGWVAKNPIWKQMPEQMLHYRAGSWFARRYCPEVLMGLQTTEEVRDVIDVTPGGGAAKLNAKIKGETK